MSLDESTRRLVKVAVAAAPVLTNDQVDKLRRLLRTEEASAHRQKPVARSASRRSRRAA